MNPSLSTAELAAHLTAYALQAALVLGVGLLLPNPFRLRVRQLDGPDSGGEA